MANTYDCVLTRGTAAQLANTPISDGKIRFCTDTHQLFIDFNAQRIEISDFIKGNTEAQILALQNPLTHKFYVSTDTKLIMFYSGNEWNKINCENANTLGGHSASYFAQVNHTHPDYVNHNAFGEFIIGEDNILASDFSDAIEFEAGNSINLSVDTTGETKKITISATGGMADTKNTAGATDTSDKIFIVGAKTQSTEPQTYTQDTAYVGADGKLYSNSKEVINTSDSQALSNKTYEGYTLGDACEKDVDTTAGGTENSTDVITSGAVYAGLAGKADVGQSLSDYGILDAVINNGVIRLGQNEITPLTQHQDISGKADVATTLAGYGITDAKIQNGTITLGSSSITPVTDISGKADVATTLAGYGITDAEIDEEEGTITLGDTTISVLTDMPSKSDIGLGNVPNVSTNDQTPTWTDVSERTNIASGNTLSTLFAKIKKWFSDLKDLAFIGLDNSESPTTKYLRGDGTWQTVIMPTVGNGTITVKKNGTSVGTFTTNQTTASDIDISVPTAVSELTNDAGYTTNTGTVTQVKVGNTAYDPTAGVISLPEYTSVTVVDTYDPTGTDAISGKGVADALDSLPNPMVFKGSLGTGGTITTLPVDGTANIGDTYKVITDGTYASQSAKVGDQFICDSKTSSANTWTYIPSGDEPSGTVTSVGLQNSTNGGLTITSSPVTTSGTISVGHTNVITAGTAKGDDSKTLTFGGTFTVPSVTYDVNGHITSKGTTTMTMPDNPNTDTKVTAVENHYAPATDESAAISASATGATAAWSIDVVKGVTLSRDAKGHVTGISVTSGKIPANPNTDTKVTSVDNHYAPATDESAALSANASGATAAWSIDVVKGITLSRDAKGHVTGVSVTSGKIPANPNTDRYVNTAAFADNTSADANNPVKMTLTRAGTDSATVTATLPKVSSSSAGVVPKGAAVSSQSQTTKFLREDGSWAAPSYTTNTDTKVTSATNHYTPTTDSGSSITGTATGATAAWSIDVVKAVTLSRDTKGHVTGISVTSGKIPANPNTDRYVNSAAFADNTSADANNPVKMTLTRAGSDTATVTGTLPKVSSSSAGVVPKGAAVSSQSQTTKFLREDGSWAAPSYTTNTNTTYTLGEEASSNRIKITPSSGSPTYANFKTINGSSIIGSGALTVSASIPVNPASTTGLTMWIET